MLEAKKIPYDIEFISLSDKPDWFLKLAPNGQVPVLVTELGTALFESDAIVEYAVSVADGFADKLINFYLAETNYLGLLSRNATPAAQSEESACEASVGGCC